MSRTATKNRWLRSLNILVIQWSGTSKKCVTACNNWQISLIILHVPSILGKRYLLIDSLTKYQYVVLTLIFKVSTRTHTSLASFWNLSCNGFFKYQSAHINEIIMSFVTEMSMPVVQFHTNCNRCQCFSNVHCWHKWLCFNKIFLGHQSFQLSLMVGTEMVTQEDFIKVNGHENFTLWIYFRLLVDRIANAVQKFSQIKVTYRS
jgi:hypothetical protein